MVLGLAVVAGLFVSAVAAVALMVAGFQVDTADWTRRQSSGFYADEAGVQTVWMKVSRRIRPFQEAPEVWPTQPGGGREPGSNNPFMRDDGTVTIQGAPVTITVTRIAVAPDRFRLDVGTDR